MANGTYIPMSAAVAASSQLEVLANNLANANTVGFKQTRTAFSSHMVEAERGLQSEKGFSAMALTQADMSAGGIRQTGNPLDLALSGPGFFMVRTPRGDVLTRAGNFVMNAEGTITDTNGNPVLGGSTGGQRQPITVRPEGGPVTIGQDGVFRQDGTDLATLSIVDVNPEDLSHLGDATYTAPAGKLTPSATATVMAGYLEDSNVNSVRGMIELIEVTRSYESAHRVMSKYQQVDDETMKIA